MSTTSETLKGVTFTGWCGSLFDFEEAEGVDIMDVAFAAVSTDGPISWGIQVFRYPDGRGTSCLALGAADDVVAARRALCDAAVAHGATVAPGVRP